MFARFNENPAMTLQDLKETKRYGRTDGQRENSIPPTNKVGGGGYNYSRTCVNGHSQNDQKLVFKTNFCLMQVKIIVEGEHSAFLSTFIKLP